MVNKNKILFDLVYRNSKYMTKLHADIADYK